jgi:hypothetical protein
MAQPYRVLVLSDADAFVVDFDRRALAAVWTKRNFDFFHALSPPDALMLNLQVWLKVKRLESR